MLFFQKKEINPSEKMIDTVNMRKISNISCNKSQNWNDFYLVLKLSVPNPLKPSVKLRMKM